MGPIEKAVDEHFWSRAPVRHSWVAWFGSGHRVRLRTRSRATLGYGKAVHHMLRRIADFTKEKGKVPNAVQIDRMLDLHFFLPIANKPAHRQMKEAAHRLMNTYATDHADVILDNEGGVKTSLAILDYKTSVDRDASHDLQLQIYASAGLREGLEVRGAYVHDLSADLPDRRVAVVGRQVQRPCGGSWSTQVTSKTWRTSSP